MLSTKQFSRHVRKRQGKIFLILSLTVEIRRQEVLVNLLELERLLYVHGQMKDSLDLLWEGYDTAQ